MVANATGNQTASVGFPLVSILTIIFVVAKIMGYITWSWWWVFSPIWISVGITLIIMAVVGIIALAALWFTK